MKASLCLALTIGMCGVASVARAESAAPGSATIPAPALFQRIILLGASGTSGFDKSEPFGGPKTLQFRFAPFVEAVSTGARAPVTTIATHLLFLNPEATMESQVAATSKPSSSPPRKPPAAGTKLPRDLAERRAESRARHPDCWLISPAEPTQNRLSRAA